VITVLVLTAAGVGWTLADPERIRQGIEQSVSSLSGKPFSIDGAFDYALGRTVTVTAERLRWMDDNPQDTPLLAIEQASVSVDLLGLLGGTVRLTNLRVRDAALHFDWSDDRFNWLFGTGGSAEDSGPVPVLIDQASLQNVALSFRHPHLADEVRLQVLSARHQADEAGRLVISGDLRLDDRDLRLDGQIGPLPQLLAAGAIDLDATLNGPLAALTVNGSTAALSELRDLVLDAGLRSSDATVLAQRLRLPLEASGDVDLSLDIDAQGEQVRLRGEGNFGEFAIDARVVTDDLASLEGLEAGISASGPSARDLATLLGRTGLPDAPFDTELRATRSANGLELQRLRFDSVGLKLEASGVVRSVDVIRDIDLDLQVEGDDFTDVATLFPVNVDAPLPYRVSASIVGKGPGQHDDLDAQLQIADMTGRLYGTLSETKDLQGSELRYELDAPDASALPLLGATMPAKAPLRLTGRMVFEDDQIVLDGLEARLGDARLGGRFRLLTDNIEPIIDFEGQASGPDLAAIIGHQVPPELANALPPGDFSAEIELRFSGETLAGEAAVLVGDSRIGFSGQLDLGPIGPELAGDLSVAGKRLGDWLNDAAIAAAEDAFALNSEIQLSGQSLRLDGLTASLGASELAGNIALSGEGLTDGRFDLRAQTDDLAALLPEGSDYRPAVNRLDLQVRGGHSSPGTFDFEQLQATMGELELKLSGSLQHAPVWSAQGLKLDVRGPRLSDLGSLHQYAFPDQPFTLNAAVDGDAKNQRIGELRFRSGDNDLSGQLAFIPGERPRMELDLKSDRLKLDDFVKVDAFSNAPDRTQQPEQRVFNDTPLPFGVLDGFDAVVRLRFDELLSQRRYWRNVVIDADVENGSVRLRQASLDAAAGRLNLSGSLTPGTAGRVLSLEIEARDAMLATESMTPEEIERLPRHAIDARLAAVGDTPRALAGSLEGFVWIVGGEGYGPRGKIAPLYGDLVTEVLTSINPAHTEQAEVRIDCDGAFLEVEQGKVRTAPALVLKTERIVMVAAGTVDLASGAIDITIETTPLRGVGLGLGDVINPLTKLSGTLRQPAVILDPKGALVEGGAAVATAGLSVVFKNLVKRLLGSGDICQRLGQQALEIRRKKDPDNLPELAARFTKEGAATVGQPASAGQDAGDARSPHDWLD